jgi:hypothetical protein
MQRKCCLAATMTLENSHELMNLAEEKSKAALCYVTEKGLVFELSQKNINKL